MRSAIVSVFMLSISGAIPANAQTRTADGDPPAAYVGISGGAQLTRSEFTGALSFPLYGEQAAVDARYDVPAGLLVDVGAGVRFLGRLGAGASVAWFREQGSAALDARLPHPLLPNRPRSVTDTAIDLDRSEIAVHPHVAWFAPAAGGLTVAVFGGPSVFRVQQDVVNGVDLDEAYPFDEVTIERPRTARIEDSAIGFHVGVDVLYRVRGRVGVGGIARFSRGRLGDQGAGGAVRLDTGGLHLAGGVRWLF